MIEEILRRWRESTFESRQDAHPPTLSQGRFSEELDDDRLKSAIVATLRPATILEVGVCNESSRAAFKHGAPLARYVGIGPDVGPSDGESETIDATRLSDAEPVDEFFVGDPRSMTRFPGEEYDLIHVAGRGDGEGTYHELTVAVSQGRYLLVDGYLETCEKCQNVSEFLQRFRDVIAWSLLIPGSTGVLLIKVKSPFLERERRRLSGVEAGSSESVREHYTESYYRNDCGGWKNFARLRARRLEDARLRSLLDLALAGRPRRLLDLGCGRGEITYQAARAGVEVTAVDYSPDAIEIAKSCFEGEKALLERVEWICGSAADLRLEGEYDMAVAGDLVEHMPPGELERMYANVRRHLAPGGRFIVHTFPNAWFYRYEYAARRRRAAALGAFLPAEPRSRYEQLMHLNEQSPQGLRRQLRRHFEHVRLWFLNPGEPAGSLAQPMNRREMAACRDLYAVASGEPVPAAALVRVLSMPPLDAEEAARARLRVLACPAEALAGEEFAVQVELTNAGSTPLVSWPPHPVHYSYHWIESATGYPLVYDGERTPLSPGVPPGSSQMHEIAVRAPGQVGEFRLELTLVHEGVRWFEQARADFAHGLPFRVLA